MITSRLFTGNEKRIRLLLVTLLIAGVFLACTSVMAAEGISADIDWAHMAMGLFGGLALFLFGMEQMSDALKSALGDQMKVLLAKLTRNRFTGALTGAFVTAVVQSSSVTTVLVVGFVSAGMMSMGAVHRRHHGRQRRHHRHRPDRRLQGRGSRPVDDRHRFSHAVHRPAGEDQALRQHADGAGPDLLRHGADGRCHGTRCAATNLSCS